MVVAGFGVDEKGARMGWVEVLGARGASLTARAAPDRDALDLDTNVKFADGAYQISLSASPAIARSARTNAS